MFKCGGQKNALIVLCRFLNLSPSTGARPLVEFQRLVDDRLDVHGLKRLLFKRAANYLSGNFVHIRKSGRRPKEVTFVVEHPQGCGT